MIRKELESTWASELSRPDPDGYTGRRLQQVKGFEAYAGAEASGPLRFVALRMGAEELRLIGDRYPRSSKGIGVETREGPDKTAIFLREIAGAPASVFTTVMADVLEAGSSGQSGSELRTAVERFASWQRALSRQSAEDAAQEARGLLGELLVLREIILPVLGPARAVQVWRSPVNDHPHDFVGERWELEVKSFLTPGAHLHVNVDGQLEASPPTRMFVAAVELDPAPDGISVLEATERLVDSVPSEAGRESLRNAAVQRGALTVDLAAEAAKRYRLVALDVYEVTSVFPLIRTGTLPRGVSSVRYQIGLAHCGPCRISTEAVNAHIEAMEHSK